MRSPRPRTPLPLPRLLPAAAVTVLAACGGAGDAATVTAPAPAPATWPGIAAALTIDPSALPNYAAPVLPAHWGAVAGQSNAPPGNRTTDAGATLGRVLFFDRNLSLDRTVACASCHRPGASFGDTVRASVGIGGARVTTAHSMRLLNLRFWTPGDAFWDRRAASLEAQVVQPIRDEREMGFTDAAGGLDSLLRRMRALRYYPELFTLAFGDSTIGEDRIRRALAQYLRSLVAADSRFDRGFAAVFDPALPDRGLARPFPGFTAEENRGKQLFLQPPPQGGAGCAGCHAPPTFALSATSRSNGLDAGETRIFRSPSLTGVATSTHFMHDGRFTSLAQVVDFYADGVQDGPALDPRLRGPGGAPQRLALSAADRAALVAFLRTLADDTTPTAARFGDPFRR